MRDRAADAAFYASDPGPRAVTALYVSAFFDELFRNGVKDVVISPGSRSTPLAMVAYASPLNVYVDIDERGASFFALGLAKSAGRPVAVVATSGTAVANYLPAVMEAESSRVPLVVLTGDRPLRLQGLGAPQTCDQLHLFGSHVRMFREMPEPALTPEAIAYARQAAREATIAAAGAHDGSFGHAGGSMIDAAPVHLNFPFDDPLTPDLEADGLFEVGRTAATERDLPPRIGAYTTIGANRAKDLLALIAGKRTVAVCGERSYAGSSQKQALLDFARELEIPLFADPLSQMRTADAPLIVDSYDALIGTDEALAPECVIRFGRWPVSKRLSTYVTNADLLHIAVDVRETRDFTSTTDMFVCTSAFGFVRALLGAARATDYVASERQHTFAEAWTEANVRHRAHVVRALGEAGDDEEGGYIQALLDGTPEGSLIFAGNSMSIRALDTLYAKRNAWLPLLCNRGLNGIDGTLSTAFGAAQQFHQTTVLLGDITALHDLNALALQGELLRREDEGFPRPSIVVVVMNNGGGAIFDMLPQKSDQAYFERLFLTPQQVDLGPVAQGFGVPYAQVGSVKQFEEAYQAFLGRPGISMIDVVLPLEGVKERYGRYAACSE